MNNRKPLADAQELHKKGRIKDAERRYRKLLKRAPGDPEISFYLGLALLQTGRGREAVGYFETVAKVAPNDPMVRDHLGQALLAAHQYSKAIEQHLKAKALAPNRPEVLFNLGIALEQSGYFAEAAAEYRKAVQLAPNFFPAWANLGANLHKSGFYTDALPVLRKAHELNPGAPEPLATLISALEFTFQDEEADRLTDKFLQIAAQHPAGLLMNAKKQERAGNIEAACDLWRQATVAPLDDFRRSGAWYELAKLQDKQGHYHEAFQCFEKSNALSASRREVSLMDPQERPRMVAAYLHRSSDAWVPKNPGQTIADMPPLFFFVGFPRSGTTLMEQVLGAHPMIETTNEKSPFTDILDALPVKTKKQLPEALDSLTGEQMDSLRETFLRSARNITGSDLAESSLVDKLPLNLVELGPIQFLLPEAKAIIALRDPRDVCLSCFMQNFNLNQSMVQFLTLESTARYYSAVMELWLHYRKTLSMKWIEYRYEDLVADFEGTARRVLDFMDLPWNDSVNRYAEHARNKDIQTPSRVAVTQPINSRAVSRWRNYEEELKPILPILEPFVKEFGYEPS